MVEFESILPYIDEIETLLCQRKSPKAVATELGIPDSWMTIYRYKKAHFDVQKIGTDAWSVERKKTRDQRLEEGKVEIIKSLEVINLAKLRAKQLLQTDLGEQYTTSKGEQRNFSLGSAAIHWPIGQRMICELSKREDEIASDDPESRKADAIESWADTRLAILQAVDNDEKAKTAILEALDKRRER